MPFVASDRTVPLSLLQDKYGLEAAGLAPTPAPAPKSSLPSTSSADPKETKSSGSRFSFSRVLSRKSSSSSSSSTADASSSAVTSTASSPRLSSSSETTLAPAPSYQSPSSVSKAKEFNPESAFAQLSDTYGLGGSVVAVPVLPKSSPPHTQTPAVAAASGTKAKKEKRSWKKEEASLEARYAWGAHRA